MPIPPQIQKLTEEGIGFTHRRREGPQKVFVYGTLKKGFNNHSHHLTGAKDLGNAKLDGIMFHLGYFPAINLSEAFSPISGEVYEVDDWDKVLGMDRLEGVGSGFYERVMVNIHPHGGVWTYVFPHTRAEKEKYVVTEGVWNGPETPKLSWLGFGRGVDVGSFETNLQGEEIKVGGGTSDYILRKNSVDRTYKLTSKKTGEVFGVYKHLRDMVGRDGKTKPVLRLPGVTNRVVDTRSSVASTVHGAVSALPPRPDTENVPMVIIQDSRHLPRETKEKDIPQAARLLGIKYGEA